MKVDWDSVGKRSYEIGIDRGMLYPALSQGVSWSGLVSVEENVEGTSRNARYFDGQKYNRGRGRTNFAATIEALTYPEEFEVFDGSEEIGSGLFMSNQPKTTFGLSYRTLLGDDIRGDELGYRIHLVYNALAAPAPRNYRTVSASSNLDPMSWNLTTQPIFFADRPVSAHVIIDSTLAHPDLISKIEDILYGSDALDPELPSVDRLVELFEEFGVLKIFDNGDGTWTADGPDEAIKMLDADTFEIDWPSAVYLSSDEYAIDTY